MDQIRTSGDAVKPLWPTFKDLDDVALAAPGYVKAIDRELPAGARGTVVGVWRGGDAFEVEFTNPFECLITVPAGGSGGVSGNAQELGSPEFLPRPVEVSEQKIRRYLLAVDHREGGSKAKFFLARGFSDATWRALANAIQKHPVNNPILTKESTDYGLKVSVRWSLATPDGSNPCILTFWMVDGTEAPPAW